MRAGHAPTKVRNSRVPAARHPSRGESWCDVHRRRGFAVSTSRRSASARQAGVVVHGYVLMANHVHLLVAGEWSGAVSRLMQALGRRFVQSFNARWADRYAVERSLPVVRGGQRSLPAHLSGVRRTQSRSGRAWWRGRGLSLVQRAGITPRASLRCVHHDAPHAACLGRRKARHYAWPGPRCCRRRSRIRRWRPSASTRGRSGPGVQASSSSGWRLRREGR